MLRRDLGLNMGLQHAGDGSVWSWGYAGNGRLGHSLNLDPQVVCAACCFFLIACGSAANPHSLPATLDVLLHDITAPHQ